MIFCWLEGIIPTDFAENVLARKQLIIQIVFINMSNLCSFIFEAMLQILALPAKVCVKADALL